MSAPKRASMREGPLAALFRKTEDLEKAERSQSPSSAPEPEAHAEHPSATGEVSSREKPSHEVPSRGEPREESSHGESIRGESSRGEPIRGESIRGESSHGGSTRGAPSSEVAQPREPPHPSLRSPLEQDPPQVPTPQERLRHAFSSEIPGPAVRSAPGRPSVGGEEAGDGILAAPTTRARAWGEVRTSKYVREEPSRPFGEAMTATQPVIRVIGVGGAGTNAVNRMVEAEVEGVEFLAVNTDLQSLQQSTADITLHIGAEITRGLGSGSDANVGRQAAMDDYDRVKTLLKGSDMIFIAAGAGGGTGTGAAPIVARIAREIGALTVAIVTKPFGFEGSRRAEAANQGIAALADEVDTLIVVPNNRLLGVLDKQTAMVEAFRVADDVLRQGVQGISDLVTLPGLINLDFADVRTIMSDAGAALLGIGMGVGENRAVEASIQAASSPLLETSMEGARSILLSITGGADLSLWEVNEAAKAVSEAAHPDANIIFGAMLDEKLDDQVWVTVVATGYESPNAQRPRPQLREPDGEPRVKRTAADRRSMPGWEAHPPGRAAGSPIGQRDRQRDRERERDRESRESRRGGLIVSDRDVPEFIPNF